MSNIAEIDSSFYTQKDIDDLFGCIFGANGPDKPNQEIIIDSNKNIKSAVSNSDKNDELLLYLLRLANVPEKDIHDIIDYQHRYDSFKQEIDILLTDHKHSNETELVEKILHIYFAHSTSSSFAKGHSSSSERISFEQNENNSVKDL